MNIDYAAIIDSINLLAAVVLVFLLGALVFTLVRRAYLYRKAGWSLPLLLRRNLILFGALGFLVGESVILRAVGGTLFTAPSLLRLLFILHYDVIVVLAFAYYLKTEITDIEDPEE